jgi:enoyl-CoA hydratase
MMTFGTLIYSEKDSVATCVINRPEAMNALNKSVLNDLDKVIHHLETAINIRCLILTGQGEKAFVAGADIKEIDGLQTASAKSFAEHGQNLFTRLETLRIPVIAAVNGFALGGGLELALACDLIIASDRAKFGLPECTLGIIPGFGGTVRLPQRVGVAFAREISLSGNFVSAAQALQMGLVNRVVEPAQLIPAAEELAMSIASRAPLAVTAIKTAIHKNASMNQFDAMKLEVQLFSSLFASEDQKEGTKAFIEKRKPVFHGK